jgi:dTDP-4-amino-4,6-dideoxygalactose transaminase
MLGREEFQAVKKVIESGILTNPLPDGGPNVKAFEKELADYLRTRKTITTNSGTSALLMSLLASDVGPRNEVIVPSFTFIATASAILLTGAKPIFVDINLDSFNMDPAAFKAAITSRTKAVIPVDLYGLPAEMDQIKEIAEVKGIKVIEDACQALGASYKGRMAGTLGDIGCLSFYPGKVMTTGEGGALVTDDKNLADRLKKMRTHGQVEGYDPIILGGNFRMPEIEAAIGREQLRKLPRFLKAREKNAKMLSEMLQKTSLILPKVPEYCKHNWYLFTVRCRSSGEREKLRTRLLKGGINAAIYYSTPIHRTPFYSSLGYDKVRQPNAELVAATVLSLPVNPIVSEDDIRRMAEIIKKSL